ncbi:threonine--tRNA ligase [Acidithrix ferrooxidans]|uniref:Threonine--tRNA ligase n=1 Tax=Acidithrix ferrooxidans TaxID=1280514 RepID=A0A0D8HJD3_9ACTN|nr:threonine--tRNA ligase [Acidithrix ferrooxidans]KJF18085.1 threonine--tRNA ligase [Acidithrix ferrooxidans]
MKVLLPDGTSREIDSALSGFEVVNAVEIKNKRSILAMECNGELVDLSRTPFGDEVVLVAGDSDSGRGILRHSTAHVLAQAVLELWPGSKFAIGPFIQDGFYYDFALVDNGRFNDEDMERIEAKMRSIIKANQRFVREELSIQEGLDLFGNQPFKREIIEGVAHLDDSEDANEGVSDKGVSIYRNSETFVDLCRGPHVPSTSYLGSFKLMRVAGAYWRGDEKRDQLQRIYGTAWESKDALEAYLVRLDEAERRDHRKLGMELDLFHFPPEIGGGLPVFHPKGALIRHLMEDFSKKSHLLGGYQFAWTPHIAKSTLFEVSGHLEWYKDGMYPPMEMEGATYYPKPMNCPMHILIYKAHQRSYRELPLRLFEFGTVYRFERSGVLHGLARVRGLTQDDSHIFCAPSQLGGELSRLLKFIIELLKAFGLEDFEAELATRPAKSVGEDYEWEEATNALEYALSQSEIPYVRAEGEGAFYAPKIDIHLKDAIGRRWQVSTLQVDLQLPQRFDMEFVDSDNTRKRPYMIHRALFGSVERFFAILLEHYAGALPTWLSPTQITVVPVKESNHEYAESIARALTQIGARVVVHGANEPLGARIRRSKLDKTPYILVVGDRDVAAQTVGVNRRGSDKPETDVLFSAFLDEISGELVPTPLVVTE